MKVEIQSDNRTKRSWLSRFFPSVARMEELATSLQRDVDRLESENARISKERDELFDRTVRLTTGYGINEKMPNIQETTEAMLEAQKKAAGVDFGAELESASIARMLERDRQQKKEEAAPVAAVKPNGSGS